MKKYRIKEYQFYHNNSYLVQRRSIFGFWYDFDDAGNYNTGWYDSINEAKEAIAQNLYKPTSKIINNQ